jgi:hypothetical protein
MAYKFVTDREIAFINVIAKELIQHVVGQTVNYYAISLEQSKVSALYNEATRKVWNAPIQIDALINYDNPNVKSVLGTQDSQYSIEVYFHNQELGERNVVPKDGDFVEFGQVFFEITSVTQPQLIFGQVNNKIMTKCVGVPSREGQFQNGNRSAENVDNSHPVQQPIFKNS